MKREFITITVVSVLICGCTLIYPGCRQNNSDITIMTWNVENLFDDISNGTEYYDFVPGEGRWTAEDFHGKMASLSEAIRRILRGGPDIILFQEIENENVLNIFADDYLSGMNYPCRIMTKDEGSAAGTAILSRYPPVEVLVHRVTNAEFNTGRPVTEVWFKIEDTTLIVFNNHWKSKSGGAETTEPARMESAALIKRRLTELIVEAPGSSIIIGGDLNEDIDEYKNLDYAYPTALVRFEDRQRLEDSGCLPDKALLFVPLEEKVGESDTFLITPWDETHGGSYKFNEEWEKIDHFLLSSSLADERGLEMEGFEVCGEDFLVYPDGGPKRWNRERGEGYSDHLPLLLKLRIYK